MADSSYNLEVQNILSFLKMQHMNPDPQFIEPITTDINPECLVSPRYLKKYKNKQVSHAGIFILGNYCRRHGGQNVYLFRPNNKDKKQEVSFFTAAVKQSRGNYSYHRPMRAHHSLHSVRVYRSSNRSEVADAASGEGREAVEEKGFIRSGRVLFTIQRSF